MAPILIRVSRNKHGHPRPAGLGLWGPTDDTVTIVGLAANVQLHDKRLRDLAWVPYFPPDRLRSLRYSAVLLSPKDLLSCLRACRPRDCPYPLRRDCRNATAPRFLTANARVARLVPAGRTMAQLVALMVAAHYKIFCDELWDVEEARRRRSVTAPSESRGVPLRVSSLRMRRIRSLRWNLRVSTDQEAAG